MLDLHQEPIQPLRPTASLALDAIDGLGWTVGAVVGAFGLRVGLRADCRETLDAVLERLPPAFTTAEDGPIDRLYSIHAGVARRPRVRKMRLVFGDDKRLARSGSLPDALDLFDDDFDRFVAKSNRTHLALSAGVCAHRGRAILLVGGRRSGKTRLVKAMLERGAEYLSEGVALVDGRQRVAPYPRPLRLHGQSRQDVAALNAWVCRVTMPIGLIVFCRYRSGIGLSEARPVSPAQATELLSAQVLSRPLEDGVGDQYLAQLTQLTCCALERGEADAGAGEVLAAYERLVVG